MTTSLLLQLLLLLPFVSAFVHPGLLVTSSDITRIKTKLAAQLDPWQSSWNKLISIEYSQSTYTNNAVSGVYRDTVGDVIENAENLWHDAAAAFNLGLRWKVEGDPQFAKAAANILTAWGEKLKNFDAGDDQYLTTGLQGHQLVNAAELIRDYAPFADSGLKTFTDMFSNVILTKNMFFLNHEAGSEHNPKHFFANWELCNMASVMAFGVLTENQTLFDFSVEYFKTGIGNGAINNAISNLVQEPGTDKVIGQPQESGRDQGHTGLDFQLLGVIAQQAWNQGVDLYSYNSSRILLGAEYYARYNLGNDVPFVNYTNGIVFYDQISSASRGAYRPTWELLYAHYAQIKGLDVPWIEQYKNHTVESMGGFEGGAGSWGEGSGHYDGLGWGSLLYHLDSSDVDALSSPTGQTSSISPSSTVLTSASSHSDISSSTSVGPISTFIPTTTTLSPALGSGTTFATSTISASSIASTSSIAYIVEYVCNF